jgi:kojibiose phosphorylase
VETALRATAADAIERGPSDWQGMRRTAADHQDDAGWLVVEEDLDPTALRAAETAFTIGNGRFAARGSFEEGYPGAQPATLMHGIWAPHPIAVSELVNLPDWTALEITLDGERVSLAEGTVIRYRRSLDLRSGLLRRDVTWRSARGATVRLAFERFVSRAEPDVAAVRLAITAVEFAGDVSVHSALDANASTGGVAHLEAGDQHVDGATACLVATIRDTSASVAVATQLTANGPSVAISGVDAPANPATVARWSAAAGQTMSFEKTAVLVSSRDTAEPGRRARERLAELAGTGFDRLHAASAAAWARDWDRTDVVVEGDAEAQLATRFSLYHLLIAAPRDDEQVSIGAKTLSGFGYHGHVFWDMETFMLPFFIRVHPSIARNLLSYRYHRLPGARRKAAANGFGGAQIPWESAESGDEVTPQWVGDPADGGRLTRIWTGDIEIHVSAVVARGVMAYWDATGDDAFMLERGAELVLETARFWASRAEWNADKGRFEFTDVIGPDENHDHVDNNAFTNYLAAWHLRTAAFLVDWLRRTDAAAATRLGADPDTADRFRSMADAIYLPYDPATGLIEQFDGYFALQDIDLRQYEGRTRSMQSILGIEGAAETQVIKQPDVLMLAYLLPDALSAEDLAANYAYYTARTDHEHGSSLGPAMQAIMAARMGDVAEAYRHFMRAARADLGDVRGNSADGIHAASAGGLWQALVFGFAGVRFEGDEVRTEPRLPDHWTRLAFRLVHRGRTVDVDIRSPAASATADGEVRGLIFDLDGVITDTAELHFRAWKRLADDLGIPFDRRANEALRGISRRESLRLLLGDRTVSEPEARALMDRKNGYYRELLKGLTPDAILPGSATLLAAARQRGLRVALASASRNAPEVLDRLRIAGHFDAVCDGSAVEAPKPAPDLFLAAAAALRLEPSECVVFEDATEGVVAAHAAGMAAVGIGPRERVGRAEMVIDGLADADLDAIVQLRRGATAG